MSFRIEEKLNINKSNLGAFEKWIADKEAKKIYPDRIIKSIYFDNESLDMHYESEEGVARWRRQQVLLPRTIGQGPHSQGALGHARNRHRRGRGLIFGVSLTASVAPGRAIEQLVLTSGHKDAVVELDDVPNLLSLEIWVGLL